jgi:hypothetical protein
MSLPADRFMAGGGNKLCFGLVFERISLFDVLDQFTHLFDNRFYRNDGVGNRRVIGLGTDRICLSEEFLDQEIEPPALGFALFHGLLELLEVAFEAY